MEVTMRESLKALYEAGARPKRFSAQVGWRRQNIRLAGKIAQQKLLLNVRSDDGSVNLNHLIMTVGYDIPAVPIIYSRIVPGTQIEFEAVPFRHVRSSDHMEDYGLRMTKLIDARQNVEEHGGSI